MKFLLEQCKEHVEAHNKITMRSYQWARVHKLLITQFSHEYGRKVKSLSNKWEKLRSTYSKIKKLRNQTGAGVRDDGAKFIWYDQIDEILSLTANVFQEQWTKVCPTSGLPALRPMVAKKPTETVSHLGCTHCSAPILKYIVELTNIATTPLHKHEHEFSRSFGERYKFHSL